MKDLRFCCSLLHSLLESQSSWSCSRTESTPSRPRLRTRWNRYRCPPRRFPVRRRPRRRRPRRPRWPRGRRSRGWRGTRRRPRTDPDRSCAANPRCCCRCSRPSPRGTRGCLWMTRLVPLAASPIDDGRRGSFERSQSREAKGQPVNIEAIRYIWFYAWSVCSYRRDGCKGGRGQRGCRLRLNRGRRWDGIFSGFATPPPPGWPGKKPRFWRWGRLAFKEVVELPVEILIGLAVVGRKGHPDTQTHRSFSALASESSYHWKNINKSACLHDTYFCCLPCCRALKSLNSKNALCFLRNILLPQHPPTIQYLNGSCVLKRLKILLRFIPAYFCQLLLTP